MIPAPLHDKQIEYIDNSTARWNIAHGAVRTGKTYACLYRFLQFCHECPDSQLWMIGHSSQTIYDNAIRPILENEVLSIYKPFCTWYAGKRCLKYRDKTISTLGAKDEGAIGAIQGKTFSGVYCDEITLYPESIIDMIDSRLSMPYSAAFASCNPSHPDHKIKKWIDQSSSGNKNYYALHFNIDDNPFLPKDYVERLRDSTSGLFYKRNFLGLWVLAEGAIFDFFDRKIHVLRNPPRAAEYWIAGIDYGQNHPFACLLVGVNTGRNTQTGKCLWVEKEYFWDPIKKERQKTNSELADDILEFLEPYGVKNIYIDPAAESFHVELKRRGIRCVHANNDVLPGISYMTSEMAKGSLFVCSECVNTIKQIERYTWDAKSAERGEDKPIKKDDDAVDALRYAVFSHKISEYRPYKEDHNPDMYVNSRFNYGARKY